MREGSGRDEGRGGRGEEGRTEEELERSVIGIRKVIDALVHLDVPQSVIVYPCQGGQ